MQLALIGIFGLLGVFARYFAGLLTPSSQFPWATFAVNLLGCFLIGIVFVLGSERALIPPEWRIALMVGFLGGFTTFSSFCLEGTRLAEEGLWLNAAAYILLSNVLGLAAVAAGMALARRFA